MIETCIDNTLLVTIAAQVIIIKNTTKQFVQIIIL